MEVIAVVFFMLPNLGELRRGEVEPEAVGVIGLTALGPAVVVKPIVVKGVAVIELTRGGAGGQDELLPKLIKELAVLLEITPPTPLATTVDGVVVVGVWGVGVLVLLMAVVVMVLLLDGPEVGLGFCSLL